MAKHPMDNIEPGIKVTAQMSPEPTEEDLQFTRQMGVEYVVLWTDGEHANYDYFMSRAGDFRERRIKNLRLRQQRCPQSGCDCAEPTQPRCEGRAVQTIHQRPWPRWNPIHHLRPHG